MQSVHLPFTFLCSLSCNSSQDSLRIKFITDIYGSLEKANFGSLRSSEMASDYVVQQRKKISFACTSQKETIKGVGEQSVWNCFGIELNM